LLPRTGGADEPGALASNNSGLSKQHAALRSIAALVVAVRPMRSANRPARTAPRSPNTPIAKNAMVAVSVTPGGVPVDLVRAAT
jgi:hypothetical protein